MAYYTFSNNLELKKTDELIKKPVEKKSIDLFSLAKYSSFGYYLIVPIFLGIFFGFYLDNLLKTKKIFFIIGFLLGIFGSFYNLKKIYQSFKK
jgi:F0F1-type ATP synthase assembly protein I